MIKKIILVLMFLTLLYSCWESKSKEVVDVKNNNEQKEFEIDSIKIEDKINKENIEETPVINTYTMEEVFLHNTKENCLSIIVWKVYEITSFFGKHWGWDDSLLKICWKDWTELFYGQHWSDPKAKNKLESLYKWELIK